jgi:hypothetical protein
MKTYTIKLETYSLDELFEFENEMNYQIYTDEQKTKLNDTEIDLIVKRKVEYYDVKCKFYESEITDIDYVDWIMSNIELEDSKI